MALQMTSRGNAVYQPDGAVLTEFFWDRARFTSIQGPVGSGTSTACCHKIWVIANEQEPDIDGVRRTRWIVSRTTYKELRDTTIKTWEMWFPESTWGPMVRTEPMVHHLKKPHGSGDGTMVDCEVIFLALPDADTARKILASFEITGFFVNEGQNTEKGITTLLLSRCSRYPSKMRGPGPTWYGGFMDMNAPIEGHWVPYMRGDIPLPKHLTLDETTEYEKPEDWNFYVQPPGLIEKKVDGRIQYEPNPLAENQKWLQEPYAQKIKGWPKRDIDMLILNKVGLSVAGNPVYPTFSEADHVSGYDRECHPDAPLIVGLDFGRDPAAVVMQCLNGMWVALSEVIGNNESAERFAPRVRRHVMERYGAAQFAKIEFWGDPRGADGNQANEETAYQVWDKHGMKVLPATSDNNPETRRSAVELVLERRNGLKVNPSCVTLKVGLAGGYHYPKIKGVTGMFAPKPRKNEYSHVVEAFENAILGGGEGHHVLRGSRERAKPIVMPKRVLRLR